MFHALTAPQLRELVAVEMERLEWRLHRVTGVDISLRLADQAVDFLLERGTDGRYGGRHLKRALEKYLVFPFSSLIETQQLGHAGTLNIGLDCSKQKLTFCYAIAGLSPRLHPAKPAPGRPTIQGINTSLPSYQH